MLHKKTMLLRTKDNTTTVRIGLFGNDFNPDAWYLLNKRNEPDVIVNTSPAGASKIVLSYKTLEGKRVYDIYKVTSIIDI